MIYNSVNFPLIILPSNLMTSDKYVKMFAKAFTDMFGKKFN